MNDAIKAMLPYLEALCEAADGLKTAPTPELAKKALIEAECVVAALHAYLLRAAIRN